MRMLIDTHILLWILSDDPRLTPKARKTLQGATDVYVSVASIWEIAIKRGLGKIDVDVEELRSSIALSGINEIPVTSEHVLGLLDLEPIHKDPFDRLIVAVAKTEPMKLMTADRKVAAYTDLSVLV